MFYLIWSKSMANDYILSYSCVFKSNEMSKRITSVMSYEIPFRVIGGNLHTKVIQEHIIISI